MKNIIGAILVFMGSCCFAQINTFYVQPVDTDINYAVAQDSHLVVRNTSTHLNKLFLFIGGTGSSSKTYKRISEFAGNEGYDVIGIAYPNSIAAASLKNDTDSLAFNHYRQEICFGEPVSPDVSVDSLNSITTRCIKLLNYLHTTYPSQSWNQYLNGSDDLNWSKIMVGGHSQGAGHAAYLGKINLVDRVLMLAGPNDYSDHFAKPAVWLSTSGNTPPTRYFGYLSELDEIVDFDKQLSNLEALEVYPAYDTTLVDNSSSPYGNSRCLYTRQPPGLSILNHNTPIKFSSINNSVWEYMLSSDVTTSLDRNVQENKFFIYPSPTHDQLHIYHSNNGKNKRCVIRNIYGQMVWSEQVEAGTTHIDVSTFTKGVYFFSFGHETLKFIKE